MLEKIEYIFQKNDKNIELFNLLCELFNNISYVTNIENNVLCISQPNLKPETIFRLDDIGTNIKLNIENEKYLNLLSKKTIDSINTEIVKKLPISDVLCKLSGHIKRIDHTGINLPTMLLRESEWNNLINYFSSNSNIYNYPNGKPWPFVLPVTEDENKNDITNFQILRDPKFELVYDDYTNVVTIQIDIETDFSKDEIEKLFPGDYGVYFDGCNYKAIYLNYREDLDIRLDLRCNYTKYGDWENGKWLVCDGKRI